MRIGFGYDVHKLVKGRPLILGGVKIAFEKGLLGHSDADVLLHAVIDSLIGAMGEGDIGRHFPPGEARFKDVSSLTLLSIVKGMLENNSFTISNIDSTVVCEAPKISPYTEQMKIMMAETLDIDVDQINIKGKTEEGLGFTGKGEGIAAHAVCLIHKTP